MLDRFTRYGVWPHNHVANVRPEPKGDWLRYADAEKVVGRLERQLADAQATIADLQGQVEAHEAAYQQGHPSPCTLGSLCPYCEIERRVAQVGDLQQRVVQLEAMLAEEHPGLDEVCDKLTTLQADHARVLGLVQEIKEAFDGDVHQCERCGEADPLTTFDIYKTVCEAASLPAQPAQGGA